MRCLQQFSSAAPVDSSCLRYVSALSLAVALCALSAAGCCVLSAAPVCGSRQHQALHSHCMCCLQQFLSAAPWTAHVCSLFRRSAPHWQWVRLCAAVPLYSCLHIGIGCACLQQFSSTAGSICALCTMSAAVLAHSSLWQFIAANFVDTRHRPCLH